MYLPSTALQHILVGCRLYSVLAAALRNSRNFQSGIRLQVQNLSRKKQMLGVCLLCGRRYTSITTIVKSSLIFGPWVMSDDWPSATSVLCPRSIYPSGQSSLVRCPERHDGISEEGIDAGFRSKREGRGSARGDGRRAKHKSYSIVTRLLLDSYSIRTQPLLDPYSIKTGENKRHSRHCHRPKTETSLNQLAASRRPAPIGQKFQGPYRKQA